ncbi:MAG: NAD(P)/FAD-dependent oxidoreductase [Acidobacteriota bacterium]|nr:NAD(P)/FAD-dependent oxidoreductase [Acidobacteriota bacterium]
MGQSYDLVIVGTGSAAQGVAMRVRAAGWCVAVIDFRPFGGTCALRGCDPKKVLVGAAESIDFISRLQGHGVTGACSINWSELMAFKRTFTDPVPDVNKRRYAEKGIDTFTGKARFTGHNLLEVNGETLESRYFLVAAGAEPVKLGIPGEQYLVDNEDFLSLEKLPSRIVMVGGGYIASEFSHIAARAGAQVTILQRGPRILPQFDPALVDLLVERFVTLGIAVHTNAKVETIEQSGDGFLVRASTQGDDLTISADLVVHAAGRAPALHELNLDAAGVEVENGRMRLNDFLQSVSNPAIYAAGDAAQVGPPLTPVASQDAKVVAANLLEGNVHKPDYTGVPSVAFTLPPIARVGLSEAAASAQGLKFRVKSENASGWYTARRVAEPVYGFKTLVEDQTGRILGAHLVGPHADEVINVIAFAMRNGLNAKSLQSMIFAYPTSASDLSYMF